VKKIYLGCRNEEKAAAAKAELEMSTGKKIFEFVRIDTSNLDTVHAAVESIQGPVDGVILNAGGAGGSTAGDLTADGVIGSFAVNVLGHVALVEGLIDAGKLRGTVLYVGSEASRGIPAMRMARPALKVSSIDEFATIADGSMFPKFDAMGAYGLVKYVGTLWTSSMSRKHPDIRFITVSPGMTTGTNAAEEVGPFQRFMFKRIAFPLMTLFGRAHGLEDGAERYIKVLTDDSYDSGRFYASPWPSTSGELVDQATIFADLDNEEYQENAYQAVHRFLPPAGQAKPAH
jgi:NAD(P)-dependent dehydrogenase (short-subunit alcohol dehydrogenase family)